MVQLPQRGVCAHRGASAKHPENTLAAFREAIRLGAHMIEFDVYLTKDKHPVIIHDPTLDRTTNGTGRVSDASFEDVRKLDAGSWKDASFMGERVPTLEEALEIMPRNIWLNVHLKEGRECGAIAAAAIVKADRLHQAFLACNADAAAGACGVAPGIMICNMDRQGGSMAYVDDTVAKGAQFIQLAGTPVDQLPPLIEKLKANKIRINYYGREGTDDLRVLFKAGVDFPLANDIASALSVAAAFGIAPNEQK
jgi:glycerophosphoryl diester phosphodiesterase